MTSNKDYQTIMLVEMQNNISQSPRTKILWLLELERRILKEN